MASIFDVILVAFFIYATLLLLRRTHSIFIFRGILAIAGVYLAAFFLKLPLTTLVFRFLLSFLAIIIVVIFQREFRRFFEEFAIAVSRPFNREELKLDQKVVNILISSVTYFCSKRIGALIVIKGEQPLERYLSLGETLDGEISEPLLLSIFDPSSPGHDGALIIENNRVKRFGAHLPLAESFKKYTNLGTRHRSALGLAERSDALIVVVSEEKGAVTLAQNGELKTLTLEALKNEIELFCLKKASLGDKSFWLSQFWASHTQDKLIALFLSLTLWFLLVFKF